GVPTRLLDFTESPYVALYFALEAYNPHTRSDLAIFALDYSAIMDASIGHISLLDPNFKETRTSIHSNQDSIFDSVVDSAEYNVAWVTEPNQANARLDKQAGSFLLSGGRGTKISDVLNSSIYADASLYKFRIRNELYIGLFTLLRKMNITSKSLYGNLDGLAQSIRMQMQVYSV